jgi:hypothetical protein
MVKSLQSCKEVQDFIDKVLTDNGLLGGVDFAPHVNFWRTLSYTEFTTGKVPNVKPGTPILIKGNSKDSPLIRVLRGPYPPFRRMPGNGPPFFTDDQVASIAGWIDAGCPEHAPGS